LRIGFLPHQMWSNAQTSGVDLSGLAGREGQMTPWPVVKWQGSGTDSMRLVREPSEMSASANRPKLNGSVVELGEYAEHIIIGFQNMYRLLMAQRPELLAGFLPRFAHDEIRVIVRHTRAYASLLYESYHPDLLRDALERERFFDNLWKGVVAAPYLSTFIPAERRALQEGNIPIFTTFPGSRAIFTEDGEPLLSTFLVEPSLETVRQHLQKINEDDLNKQIWLIRASLATLSMEAEQHEPGHRLLHLPAQVDEKRTGTIRERARAAAQALGKRLSELALRGKDGVSWIGINRRKGGGWSLVPADESLYNGVPGITLFLGYLGALLDDTAITELARLALATVRYQVEHQKKYPEVTSIGAFEGLGAATYLYTHLGVLWNDVALLQEAAALVEYLPDLIRKDVRLDITGGAAGCIMSLLCLYDAFPDPRIMHVACQCGDHLISTAHPMKEGIGWRIAGQNTPLSGFSHGAAGIALSLFKLAAQSGEERFRQTAQATIAYERSLYSPDRQNWLDLRGISFANNSASQQPAQEPEESCMVTWCHGAPGIALSRLEALSYCDDGAMREEIEVALKTTLTQGFGGNHSLCHGDLGNLDVVLKAAHTLDNPVYQEHVEHLTTTIIDSMETTGWLTGVTLRVETPGLMLGLAGIGYELLRLTEPERVPSVLLLAPPGTTHPNWRKTLIASL